MLSKAEILITRGETWEIPTHVSTFAVSVAHRLVASYFCLHGAFLCDVFFGVTEVFPFLEATLIVRVEALVISA